jgi:predicted negative regulator of RcsB-dependent stress response
MDDILTFLAENWEAISAGVVLVLGFLGYRVVRRRNGNGKAQGQKG